MKRLIQFIFCLPLLVALHACTNTTAPSQSEVASPVSIEELKKGSISKLINTSGTAMPIYGADLTAQMSGLYKLQINPATGQPFKLGDRVKKGQIIIRLEDKEYENNIAYETKKLNLEIAEQEKIKQDTLYQLGGVTLSDMRNTEVKVLTAATAIENAELNLEKMAVVAPFNGVIVDLPHYTPDVKVESGKALLGIMEYARMYVDINLPESAISYVKPQQPVHITHYTLPNDTLSGVITELSPAISTETRTFKGKILIQNDELKIRPGMFVKADIVVDKTESAIIIPKEVIQSNRQRKFVFIVEKNAAILKEILTGLEDEKNVEIISGLKEGDNLIIKGYETLRENSKVKVQ
ncbi:MAG: efflux RND transporter periplasmic adaptor subunit [Dysgonamonadaceae bacterium]|jgi:RND family efflux transporter MFP subunit|nr:efflux RND transporter periplasmic adaptor subunit [Dysgonamonadaceae bacterium]